MKVILDGLPVNPRLLTLVTTARMAIPCMMGCHAPISWAFSGTMRLNWVVSFHASTLISRILFTRASRGASGKEATNKVTNPNWITVNGMDTHHGREDRWEDKVTSSTLVKKCKRTTNDPAQRGDTATANHNTMLMAGWIQNINMKSKERWLNTAYFPYMYSLNRNAILELLS